MENNTVFVHPSGAMYAVSERVMSLGYTPQDGARVATEEERVEFIARVTATAEKSAKNPVTRSQIIELLKIPGGAVEALKRAVERLPEETLVEEPELSPEPAPEPVPEPSPEPIEPIDLRDVLRNSRGSDG